MNNSLKSSFDLRMEVSKCGRCMWIENGWIDTTIVIIYVTSRLNLIDQTILDHIRYAQKYRQPFVVRDLLSLCNIDSSCFLICQFVIPVRVDLLEYISDSIVFTHQNDLQNGQSRILICSHITGAVTDFIDTLCIAWGWCVLRWWWPFITSSFNYRSVIYGKKWLYTTAHHLWREKKTYSRPPWKALIGRFCSSEFPYTNDKSKNDVTTVSCSAGCCSWVSGHAKSLSVNVRTKFIHWTFVCEWAGSFLGVMIG